MRRTLDLEVSADEADVEGLRRAAARALGLADDRVTGIDLRRRAIDARHRRVRVLARVEATVDAPFEPERRPEPPALPMLSGEPPVVIVGAGPAGLFAAWGLARRGIRSVLLERGPDVRGRRPHLARLNREGTVDADANYCFGEGGAGTFSDGKLYTRATKRGDVDLVLALLAASGAPGRILYDARPHIGTNRLPQVVTHFREQLEAAGVVVRFGARVTGLEVDAGHVRGVTLADGERISARAVVLATGHSARDVYRMLEAQGVAMTAKGFAMGVRIEHPQAHIDALQYGTFAGHPQLGAAPYSLARTDAEGVGVYSFCMCPGGFIVAAATDDGGVVVNGMSPHARGSRFANSGLVVSLGPETYGEGVLSGLAYQDTLERRAFEAGGGGFKAPAQRVTDFLAGRVSTDLPVCSYRPGLTPVELRTVLPERIWRPLEAGLRDFDRKMRGYVTHEAVLVGVESRSSAPVRIERDGNTLQSPTHAGLYPAAEGAGYAGGIVSAALDGLRIAEVVRV